MHVKFNLKKEYVFCGGKEGHIILSIVYNKTVVYKLQNDMFNFFLHFPSMSYVYFFNVSCRQTPCRNVQAFS